MPNQTVKNGLKAKKIGTNKFFSRKTTNEIFMYLLAPFILQNLQKIKSYEDVPFSGPKWHICPEQNLLGTNHYYYFRLPIGSFYCGKFKKILTADPELRGCTIFWAQNCIFTPNNFFFGKLLISLSSTY